ncbi:MAG: hypothetical protein HQK83_09420 [Fibrobacteria bacterium]|nr:hypothetical protein [Fibrobacteria bacterium]
MRALYFSILLFIQIGMSQITFTSIPQNMQIYPRNPQTDSAKIVIEGTVTSKGVVSDKITVKTYRDNNLFSTLSEDLAYTGQTAAFKLTPQIKAELAHYKIEVYTGSGTYETLEKTVDSIAAGDAFIIQGQSNAEARKFDGSANENQNSFIRVYGSGDPGGSSQKWFVADGDGTMVTNGSAGQWGIRMARQILDNQKIPVALFNGAHGAKTIQFFARNDNDTLDQETNYGRLLKRVQEAGLQNHIRALIWHQGESNADENFKATTAEYKTMWTTLHQDWLIDYPSIEKTYIFQIRNGCYASIENILQVKEALRQLALETTDVEIMSTSAYMQNNNCHFPYEVGYKHFGDNIYRLLNRDLYGAETENDIEPPMVLRVERTGNREITLVMDNADDSYTWDTEAEKELSFVGASVQVTSVTVEGRLIKLGFSGDVEGVTSITFRGHQGTPAPMVTNANGIGSVHFNEFPVIDPVAVEHDLKSTLKPITVHHNGGNFRFVFTQGQRFRMARIVTVNGEVVKDFENIEDSEELEWNARSKSTGVYYLQVGDKTKHLLLPVVVY